MADKGNAQIYEGNESTSQRFRITNVGRDANHEWIYCITNIGSGRVLEAQGGKTSSGTNVSQYGFNGSEAQLWYIRQVEGEDGTIRYCFVNYKSAFAAIASSRFSYVAVVVETLGMYISPISKLLMISAIPPMWSACGCVATR